MRTLPASADQRNQNLDRKVSPHRRGSVAHERVEPTAATRYSVYSGADTDRLGSYGRAGDTWIAFDRLGKPIGGFFDSEIAAIAAIEREAVS